MHCQTRHKVFESGNHESKARKSVPSRPKCAAFRAEIARRIALCTDTKQTREVSAWPASDELRAGLEAHST